MFAIPGDFSQEQLQLTGLAVPEGNVNRQGAENFTPGSDGENFPDAEDEELGRDDTLPDETPAPAGAAVDIDIDDIADQVSQLGLETPRASDQETVGSMTYRKHLHIIPGFEFNNTVTKTMYLCQCDLPGGVTEATAVAMENLKGVRLTWNEPGRAYNAEEVTAVMHQNPRNAVIRAHLRNAFEEEIAAAGNHLARVNNSVANYVEFDFPEACENQLINPADRDTAAVVHIRTLLGGRAIAFVAAWQRRNTSHPAGP
ncbi:MAG: hypothetical protein SGARI_000688 [Bacillariaceae sp.]